MGTYEIYTYGSGDFIAQIFTGIALMFSGNAIADLVKVVLLVGLLVAILHPITSWLTKGQAPSNTGGEGIIAMLRQVLLAGLVLYAFILPKANVSIIDRIDPNQSTVVGNVPMLQAIVAYGASQIGDTIGKEMETAFSLPDSMTFRNGGLGLGIKYIDTVFTVQPPSASTYNNGTASNGALVRQSLYDYFSECVFPNYTSTDGGMGDRTVSLNALANSTNILQTLQTYHNLYDSSQIITGANDNGQSTCTTALADINAAWNAIYLEWVKEIETKVSNGASTNVNTLGTGVMTNEIMSRYFPGPLSTQEKLKNIAVANLMREATRNYAARFGDAGSAAASLSTSSAVSSWQTTARMFGAIVHTMRNVFEGLIYGLACLLPVAVAVAGLSALATYFKIVLWLQLWVPFYVLLNLFGDMEMTRALQSLSMQTNSPGDGISVKMFEDVAEKAQLSLGYLGSLSFTVPMFAWGLLKGGEYAMSSAVGAMTSGGGAAAQASNIGGQVGGLGNVNVGNKSLDSHSFKSSTAAGSSFSYQTGQGAMQSGMTIEGMTGRSITTQSKISAMDNSFQRIAGFNAGGSTPEGLYGNITTNADWAAGQTATKRLLASSLFPDDPDAAHRTSSLLTNMTTGADVRKAQQVSQGAGIGPDTASNRIAEATASDGVMKMFQTEAFVEKMAARGILLPQIGEIQSRSQVARTSADQQFSQAYHNMNALTDTQRQMFTNWGVRTALGNNNDNIENFYNRVGYMNTAEQTGKMDAAQNYVDRHGMSFVDFYTGMNSHGKLFNVDMAWGQNGGTLFTQKLTGNSSTDNNLHQSIAGNMNKYYDNYSERTSGSKTDNYHGVVNNYSGTTENTGNAGGFLALHTDKYDLLNHMRKSVNMDRVWTNQGALKDFQTKVTAGFNALGSKSNDASSAFGFDVSGGIKGTPGIFYGKAGLDYSAQAVDQTRVNEISAKFTNQTNKLFNDVTKTTEQKTQLAAGMIHQYQSELRGMGDQTKVGRVGNTGLGDAEGALRSMGAGKAVDKGKEMLGLTSNTPPNSATREY